MKCKRSTNSDCKDKGIWKSELVAKTQFFYTNYWNLFVCLISKHVLVCLNLFLTTFSQSRMRVPEISQHQHPGYPIQPSRCSSQHPGYPGQHSRYPAQQPPCPIQPYTPPISVVPELRVPVGVCWRCRKLYQEQTEVETVRYVTKLNVTSIMNHHSFKVAEVEIYIMG